VYVSGYQKKSTKNYVHNFDFATPALEQAQPSPICNYQEPLYLKQDDSERLGEFFTISNSFTLTEFK